MWKAKQVTEDVTKDELKDIIIPDWANVTVETDVTLDSTLEDITDDLNDDTVDVVEEVEDTVEHDIIATSEQFLTDEELNYKLTDLDLDELDDLTSTVRIKKLTEDDRFKAQKLLAQWLLNLVDWYSLDYNMKELLDIEIIFKTK